MAARNSKAEFDEIVLKSKLPVIVDFYSDSCVACDRKPDPAFCNRRRGLRQKGRRTKACRFESMG